MGLQFPVVARTSKELSDLATPRSAPGGQSEAVAHVFFDTLTYVSATTTSLTFFNAVRTPDQSNMESAGQFPEGQWFEPYYLGLDVLEDVGNGTTGTVPPWDDVQQLVMSGRGTVTFTYNNKQYLRGIPTSFLHTSGGVTGFGISELGDTIASGALNDAYANNSIPDGGFCLDGTPIFKPKTGFNFTLSWPAALTLSGNQNLRLWMAGVWHRAVL